MIPAAAWRRVAALVATLALVGCRPTPEEPPAPALTVRPLGDERLHPTGGPPLAWQTFHRARNLLLERCQRYGPSGPIGYCTNAAEPLARAPRFAREATPSPVYYLPVTTSRPAERHLAIEVQPQAFTGSWLLALLDLLADDLPDWRIGLSVGGHDGVGGYLELSVGQARGTGVFGQARDLQDLLAAGAQIRAAAQRAAQHRLRRLDAVRQLARQAGLADRLERAPIPLAAFADDSRRWTDPPATLWIAHHPDRIDGGEQLDRHYATLHLFADGAIEEAPLRDGQPPLLELVEWALPVGAEAITLPGGRLVRLAPLRR